MQALKLTYEIVNDVKTNKSLYFYITTTEKSAPLLFL